MKPVAIFRHSPIEGPGYFATFLEANGVPWQLIAVDAGEAIPTDTENYSGLAFMGGPMSVNDPLPWVENACTLIRSAVDCAIPVIGHCLGGQLMAKALGGQVKANPVKEIGWGEAKIDDVEVAQHWLGDFAGKATVFQWHGETFSIPAGTTRLMSNDWCAAQMFVCGPHLAMQCHVEMTPEMIAAWCECWEAEVAGLAALPPPVQTPQQMKEELAYRLPAMRELANRLYGSWIRGLKR
ncbi:MAG: type 1 glutamine amidotransferase [Betaproteobacteria bacterium]|uniref:Type 1 glutamine amidotransferase n=1 Tax=Candidatus Proximibacter danicus TaxID=2954365 RepID=A0A9D7JYI1_9PROT|nr:type 1 glutamine amidotransferase [Candidatus Proximibacter danicus]MBK9446433.1 type 1 glutamine amidotransferase [Betaproteobacteria bacterium]